MPVIQAALSPSVQPAAATPPAATIIMAHRSRTVSQPSSNLNMQLFYPAGLGFVQCGVGTHQSLINGDLRGNGAWCAAPIASTPAWPTHLIRKTLAPRILPV